ASTRSRPRARSATACSREATRARRGRGTPARATCDMRAYDGSLVVLAAAEPRDPRRDRRIMLRGVTLKRMDNVLIVVEDIEAAKAFFAELGMELQGETQVEGPWVDHTVGLDGVRADIAMMRTPDGHCGVELTRFHTPPAVRSEPAIAPANTLGLRRIMFSVEGLDDVVARLRGHGAEL